MFHVKVSRISSVYVGHDLRQITEGGFKQQMVMIGEEMWRKASGKVIRML